MLRGLVATLLLLGAMFQATAAEVAPERARLEGAWTAVEAQRNGAAADDLVGHRLEFAGERFRISAQGRTLFAGTYSLDPAARPARIDFRHDEGEAKGQDWEGIYRLEGGRLTICDDAPNPALPRPREFATAPGSGYVMLVFGR